MPQSLGVQVTINLLTIAYVINALPANFAFGYPNSFSKLAATPQSSLSLLLPRYAIKIVPSRNQNNCLIPVFYGEV